MTPLRRSLAVAGTAALFATVAVAGEPVELLIRMVVASDREAGIDDRLDGQRDQIENLFEYRSYRLVKEERRKCRFGNQNDFELPGGRMLHVVPRSVEGGRLRMHVRLPEGPAKAPALDTVFSLPNRGNLWVAGPHHPEGVLLISIGASSR